MTATYRSIFSPRRGLFCILLSGLILGGCASASQQRETLHALSIQTGVRMESYAERPSREVADTLRVLLEQPLTSQAAVQVAVLNSPHFQALLQDLGIARADLRQGRLLPNPTLDLAIRGEGAGEKDYEYALMEDLKGVLLYPLQRGMANAQYTQAKAHLADELMAGIEEVKAHFFALQGSRQDYSLLQTILQTAEAGAALAERQHQAGNINALELAAHQALLHETRLALAQAEAAVQIEREVLGRLLGLGEGDWQIAEELPHLPSADPSLPELEQTALSQRPDLEAARAEIRAMAQVRKLARFSRVPSLHLGVSTKKEEVRRTIGPAVELEIPLFGQGQAAIARARAQQGQSQHRLRALEAEVRSQVRISFAQMELARQRAQLYQEALLPLRTQVVAETQKHYNYMLLGVYQLLQARRDEVAARQAHIAALKDYWVARSQLERAIGGPLSPSEGRPPAEGEKSPSPPSHPHSH